MCDLPLEARHGLSMEISLIASRFSTPFKARKWLDARINARKWLVGSLTTSLPELTQGSCIPRCQKCQTRYRSFPLGGWLLLRRWMLIRAFVAPASGAALPYISHGAVRSSLAMEIFKIQKKRLWRRSRRSVAGHVMAHLSEFLSAFRYPELLSIAITSPPWST